MRFCCSHGVPEIHGCGSAAKSAARQQIVRDGILYSGSGRPNMLPDPTTTPKVDSVTKKSDKENKHLSKHQQTQKVQSSSTKPCHTGTSFSKEDMNDILKLLK